MLKNGEGSYVADEQTLDMLEAEGRVVARYLDNPNGSQRAIAGVTNEAGNVVGLMPHPEHAVEDLCGPGTDGLGVLHQRRRAPCSRPDRQRSAAAPALEARPRSATPTTLVALIPTALLVGADGAAGAGAEDAVDRAARGASAAFSARCTRIDVGARDPGAQRGAGCCPRRAAPSQSLRRDVAVPHRVARPTSGRRAAPTSVVRFHGR